ncbi:MAG: hypothetical protein ACI4VW_01880 [Acutalibacteraceae bacterium]
MKLKFNMETDYIPYTTVFEKRDMMFDWTQTSERASHSAYAIAVCSFLIGYILCDLGDFFEFSMYGVMLALIIGGIYCKRWKLFAYYLNILAFMYFDGIVLSFIAETNKNALMFFAVGNILGIGMSYFSLRCIYNYKNVFKELEKCKGFPNFMVNGQDLYADKLYLKDEEEEIGVSESSTPKSKTEPIVMHIDVNSTHEEIRERKSRKHKHGKSVFGIDIIFPHDDPEDMSFEDKKGFMYDWNRNVEFTVKGIIVPIFLMMLSVLFSVIAGGGFIVLVLGYGTILLLILGTNYMKMGKWWGSLMTVGSLLGFFCLSLLIGYSGNGIPFLFIFITSLINIKILLPTIRYLINYPTYKELSTHEGFPSFVRNYADLYGSKAYIVEKWEPTKKKILSDNEKIEMFMAGKEEPKEEEKGWNAFDYMDEEKEE